MPDHVFNVGAVVIAKLSVETGQAIEELSAQLAEKYRRGYEDDDFEKLWVIVANALTSDVSERKNLGSELQLLLYYTSEYDADGSKRKRRGAMFNKQREPISDRVQRFSLTYARFLTLMAAGNLPLPSKDWTFQ